MTQPFPVGATIGEGRLMLVECLAGLPEQGVYLAAGRLRSVDSPPMPANFLVSTALSPDDSEPVRQRARAALLLPVPGVAPLHDILPLDAHSDAEPVRPGLRRAAYPPLIAMVESCPSGVRSHEWRPLPMPARTAAGFALRTAFSLAAAHEAGIAIGGIRPEHIFVSGTREAPDVSGIAPRAERFWQMLPRPHFGIVPAYVSTYDSPEQLRLDYDGRPSPPSDIFSLCATLAFWLSGRHPFAGETHDAQTAAICEGRRSAHATAWTSPLAVLVDRGLATDPAARPTITEALALLKQVAPDARPAWEESVP